MVHKLINAEYINIFKFDLYRKINQSDLSSVMELIAFISKGRIRGTTTEAMSLLVVANQRIIESLKLH